jgi:hypothetical protein
VILTAIERPATRRFVALTVGLAWIVSWVLWNADFRSFFSICDHDPGAALRVDEIVAQGARPGIDFFYYYGFLPIAVTRAFFSVFGRSPTSLLLLNFVAGSVYCAGLASTVAAFRPTRLGAVLVALGVQHTIAPGVPTHVMESAMLVWAVNLRVQGKSTPALALAVVTTFVKISMATVISAELVGLVTLDAIRLRSARPLRPLWAVPAALGAGAAIGALMLGGGAVATTMNPGAGAGVYRAYDMGFLRAGLNMWYPRGHAIGWYVGGVMGPWLFGTAALSITMVPSLLRLMDSGLRGAGDPGPGVQADEVRSICGFANLALIAVFFGPWVYDYTWIVLVGATPWLARARLSYAGDSTRLGTSTRPAAWLALAAWLLLSAKSVLTDFTRFVRETRIQVGQVTMPSDEAHEWQAMMSVARSIGKGEIGVLGRVSNFRAADQSLQQGPYWMMIKGMRRTSSVDGELRLLRSTDTFILSKFDYDDIVSIPEFRRVVEASTKLLDGKYFLLLRPADGPPSQ